MKRRRLKKDTERHVLFFPIKKRTRDRQQKIVKRSNIGVDENKLGQIMRAHCIGFITKRTGHSEP